MSRQAARVFSHVTWSGCISDRRSGLTSRPGQDHVQIGIDAGNEYDLDSDIDGLSSQVSRLKQVQLDVIALNLRGLGCFVHPWKILQRALSPFLGVQPWNAETLTPLHHMLGPHATLTRMTCVNAISVLNYMLFCTTGGWCHPRRTKCSEWHPWKPGADICHPIQINQRAMPTIAQPSNRHRHSLTAPMYRAGRDYGASQIGVVNHHEAIGAHHARQQKQSLAVLAAVRRGRYRCSLALGKGV